MKILIIGNLTDVRCGFMNFTNQTIIALERAGHEVWGFDGTYAEVYARQQRGVPDSFLPEHAAEFDVIHVIWHPATLNHYSGAVWPAGPVLSVWNGCPACWCPFTAAMDIRWGVLGKEGPEPHQQIFYPIPDWVDPTRLSHRQEQFIVGYSGVRGDGLEALKAVCQQHHWATNFSTPDTWYSIEDEILRLSESSVNVGWYGAEHDDRSGSAMMCLASRRPFLCNQVRMFHHVLPYAPAEIYTGEDLSETLLLAQADWRHSRMRMPRIILEDFSWTRACRVLEEGWREVAKS